MFLVYVTYVAILQVSGCGGSGPGATPRDGRPGTVAQECTASHPAHRRSGRADLVGRRDLRLCGPYALVSLIAAANDGESQLTHSAAPGVLPELGCFAGPALSRLPLREAPLSRKGVPFSV